jgi:TPM domain/Zinc finger, C3HC4 type (RING finger)
MQTRCPSPLAAYNDHPEKAAEVFARQIHDTWRVGMTTASCGGTGMLMFISELDRTIYISRGSALESVLTRRRLDKTIENMQPLLSKQLYGAAILSALRKLDNCLIAGEPDWKERTWDFCVAYSYLAYFGILSLVAVLNPGWTIIGAFAVLGIMGFFALNIVWAIREAQEQGREYTKVASQLNELNRSHAEFLQGRFQAKSCPICFKNFQDREETSCINSETETLTRKGALKLLRCGHVFDDTCWAEWVSSGRHGKVDKCPICQQDVGKSLDGRAYQTGDNEALVYPVVTTTTSTTTPLSEPEQHLRRVEEEQNRAVLQYTHERLFRLMRLGSRYPQFVRPQHIQVLMRVGYDRSLACDPGFVNSDPACPPSSSPTGSRYRGPSGRVGRAVQDSVEVPVEEVEDGNLSFMSKHR